MPLEVSMDKQLIRRLMQYTVLILPGNIFDGDRNYYISNSEGFPEGNVV
jgi:hypothetical protein